MASLPNSANCVAVERFPRTSGRIGGTAGGGTIIFFEVGRAAAVFKEPRAARPREELPPGVPAPPERAPQIHAPEIKGVDVPRDHRRREPERYAAFAAASTATLATKILSEGVADGPPLTSIHPPRRGPSSQSPDPRRRRPRASPRERPRPRRTPRRARGRTRRAPSRCSWGASSRPRATKAGRRFFLTTVSIAGGAKRSTRSRQRRRVASAMTYVTRGRSRIPGARCAARTPRGTTIPRPRSRPDDGEAKDRGVRHPSRARPPGKTRRSSRAVSTAIPGDGPRPAPQPPARAACPPNARSRWNCAHAPRPSLARSRMMAPAKAIGGTTTKTKSEVESGSSERRAGATPGHASGVSGTSRSRGADHTRSGARERGWAVSFPE